MSYDQPNMPDDAAKDRYRIDPPTRMMTTSAVVQVPAEIPEVEEGAGPNASQVLHALRRKWLPAIAIGLVLAIGGAAAVWFAEVPEYTARGMLRISSSQGSLLDSEGKGSGDFDVYKLTHRQLLRGPFVINAALRNPEVASLSMIREEVDPVSWVQQNLQVSFPDNAEIMEVKMSGENPNALAKLVNSVIQAYMDEVVDAEANQRRARLSSLERAYSEKENDLRTKRSELRRLADTLGTGDTASLSLVQQNALQQFAVMRGELTRVQLELLRAQGNLIVMEATPAVAASDTKIEANGVGPEEAKNNSGPVDLAGGNLLTDESVLKAEDLDVKNALATDSVTVKIEAEIMLLEEKIASVTKTASPALRERYVEPYQARIDKLRGHLSDRRDEIRKDVAEWRQSSKKATLSRAKSEIAILEQMQKQLQADVAGFEEEAKQFGRSSVDVEMMRTEIVSLEEVLSRLGREIENTKIELKSDSRVTFYQEAQTPRTKNPRSYAKVGMAGFAGLLLPIAGLVWWDLRSQRINTPTEVSQNLRMNVIGTIPLVPRRVLSNSNKNSRNQRYWKNLISESVDGIVARLFRQTGGNDCRVVMVSSALAGEGKTTLTGQLAYALAETGARTIIVDFDLRRPALDISFGVELSPGVTELLCGEVEFEEAIQSTGHPNLDIIAAGDWEHNSLRELTGERMNAFFKSLRGEYDYVLVDGSPVLPVVDTRLIGQFVDGIVLSVLRDVSCASKVMAARDLLTDFGVRFLGAVVVGTTKEDVYHYSSRSRQKRLVASN